MAYKKKKNQALAIITPLVLKNVPLSLIIIYTLRVGSVNVERIYSQLYASALK